MFSETSYWLLQGLLKFCSLHHLIAPLPDSPSHKIPSLPCVRLPPSPLLEARAGNLAWLLPRLGPVSKTLVPLLLCRWLCLLLLDWASWSAVAGLLCGWFRDAPGSSCLPPSAEGQSCHVSDPSACKYSLRRAGTDRTFPILCKWLNLPKGDYTKKGATLETSFF